MNSCRWLLWICLCLVAVLSCDRGLVGGQCAVGLVPCDGVCVNIGNDESNCGLCGIVCLSNETCRAGLCLPDNSSSDDDGSGGDDASVPSASTDADAGPGGANTGGADAGALAGSGGASSVGGNSGAGAESPCLPPFNTGQRCGDCETACPEEAPNCAPKDGTFACVPDCEAPLTLCGSQCVNLDSNPAHCGACNNSCPTGLCENRGCVGGVAGHVVLICMSYDQVFGNSSQVTLLGNAVFLSLSGQVRLLLYEQFASEESRFNVRRSIDWAAATLGRSFSTTVADTAQEVANRLDTSSFDALLVLDQPNAPDGSLAQIGSTIRVAVAEFTGAGGTTIILAGAITDEVAGLVNAAFDDVFDVRGTTVVDFLLNNRAPADAIGLNVPTPFRALDSTCAWETNLVDVNSNVVVAGTLLGDAGGEAPVVIHRVVPPL